MEQVNAFKQIDTFLGAYYQQFGANDYFNQKNNGRFLQYIIDEELNDDDIPLATELGSESSASTCIYIEFDTSNFPIDNSIDSSLINNRREIIFYVLQYIYQHNALPTTEYIQNSLLNKDQTAQHYQQIIAEISQLTTYDRQKGLKLLFKIIRNILSNPSNKKYQYMNVELLSKKLTNYKIWFELLQYGGFHLTNNKKQLVFDIQQLQKLKSINNALVSHKWEKDAGNINQYICICGKQLEKIVNPTALYDGDGVCCDECHDIALRNDIFWHCSDEYHPLHDGGFDVCSNCVCKYESEIPKTTTIQNNCISSHNKFDDGIYADDMAKTIIEFYQDQKCVYVCICGGHLVQTNYAVVCCECGCETKQSWQCNNKLIITHFQHSDAYNVCVGCLSKYRIGLEECTFEPLNCNSCKELIFVLNNYQKVVLQHAHYDKIDKINCVELLDNYFHSIFHHEYYQITKQLQFCDISSCAIFRRNYRNRQKWRDNLYDNTAKVELLQILDKIHCFYLHSEDIGNMLAQNDAMQFQQNENWGERSQQIAMISKLLATKKKNWKDIEIDRALKYNQLSEMNDEESKTKDSIYRFGNLFTYDSPENFNKTGYVHIDVRAKHDSLKRELTHNAIIVITMKQYDQEYNKAQMHYSSKYCKNTFDCNKLQPNHLLSVMIYCNYDQLQSQFSKTYRDTENHSEFYHLAKLLKDAVQTFGIPAENAIISKFYHGIGEKLVFEEILDPFNTDVQIFSPLSTTSCFAVASNFTNQSEGLIVTFSAATSSAVQIFGQCINQCFSCAWLSDYASEKEYLFIQNELGLNIDNILMPSTGKEFSTIIDALRTVGLTISDSVDDHDKISVQISELAVSIIEDQLSHKIRKYKPFKSLSKYAKTTINVFFNKISEVRINYALLMRQYLHATEWGELCKYFIDTGNEWIETNIIISLFPNVKVISLSADLTSQTMNRLMKDLNHNSSLETFNIFPINDSGMTITEAVEMYAETFRTVNAFAFTTFGYQQLSVILCNKYDFCMEVIRNMGKIYINDVDDCIAHSVQEVLMERLNFTKQKYSANYKLFWTQELELLDLDWKCLKTNSNKYCSYLRNAFCYTKIEGLELNALNTFYPNLKGLWIRRFNLSLITMDKLLLYFTQNQNSTIKNIQIDMDQNIELNAVTVVAQYDAKFNKIGYTLKVDSHGWLAIDRNKK